MKQAIIPSVAVLLLAACAENVSTSDDFNRELTFCVSNAPLTTTASITRSSLIESDYEVPLYMIVTSEPVSNNLPTRSTEVTTDGLNASGKTLRVSAYSGSSVQSWCDGETASFNTSDNLFHTGIDWSSQSGDYDFYVWHPASGSGLTVSGNNLTYDIASLASSAMPDLLGAKVTTNYAANHGRVDVALGHQLTPVCFKLAANYCGGTIKSISFSNIVTAATQVIGSGSWSATTTGAYTTQTLSTTGTTTEVQVDGSEYFMMIPQTIAAGTVITITTQKGEGQLNTLTYTVPDGGFTWSAGQAVTYTISTTAITTLTATYPTWNDNNTETYGPVDAYTAGESFGLFAVDAAGKVVLSNVQVSATSVSGHTATCDLTSGTNATNLSNYILSQNYTYYIMYPYVSSLSVSDVALGSTGHASQTADQFFSTVASGWAPVADQHELSTYKSQDLQVAQVNASSYNAPMAHKMGLDCIELGTSTIVETRYFQADGTTFVEDDGTKTITASSNFVTNIPYSNSSEYYFIKNPNTTVTFNSVSSPDKDRWSAALTPTPSAGHVANATASPYKNSTNTKDGRTGDYYYKGWVFDYTESVQDFDKATQAGNYKLEVWGAQGGDGRQWNSTTRVVGAGGQGGYTYGTYNLPEGQHLYVCVGGQGAWADNAYNDISTRLFPPGGYNGGGAGGTETEPIPENAAGGGGATHIATTNRGVLADYSSYQDEVLIVAGGGGGAAGDFGKDWNTIKENYDLGNNPTKSLIVEKIGTTEDSFGFFDDAHFHDKNLITDYCDLDPNFEKWDKLNDAQKKAAIAYSVYKWHGGAGGGGADVAGATTYDYSYPGPATQGTTYTHDNITYPLFGQGRQGYNVGNSNVGGTGGGGGGWYGGYHKDEHHNNVSAGGAGGSSHISNSLTNTGGESGVNNGDGKARIRSDFEWY